MSTSLSQTAFGEALSNFKRRLGLEGDEDLFVLVNVSMSPFPTEANFVSTLAQTFKGIANEAILQVRFRFKTLLDPPNADPSLSNVVEHSSQCRRP